MYDSCQKYGLLEDSSNLIIVDLMDKWNHNQLSIPLIFLAIEISWINLVKEK
jgi:hypothetical protein